MSQIIIITFSILLVACAPMDPLKTSSSESSVSELAEFFGILASPIVDQDIEVAVGETYSGFLIQGVPAGMPLSFVILAGGSGGQLTINNESTGEYTYAAGDAQGVDSFRFQVSSGSRSLTYTVTVNIVQGQNEEPDPSPDPDPVPTPDPDPVPQPNPVGEIKKVALAGCSQTNYWVGDNDSIGYEDILGGDLFTSTAGFGGGSLDMWVNPAEDYQGRFQMATDGSEDIILAQICIHNERPVDYNDLLTWINFLKAEVPGKPLYLMPLDVSTESSGCPVSGYDQSVELMNQAVAEGHALLGPHISPLYNVEETIADNCHPSDAGAARMTETVRQFIESL